MPGGSSVIISFAFFSFSFPWHIRLLNSSAVGRVLCWGVSSPEQKQKAGDAVCALLEGNRASGLHRSLVITQCNSGEVIRRTGRGFNASAPKYSPIGSTERKCGVIFAGFGVVGLYWGKVII